MNTPWNEKEREDELVLTCQEGREYSNQLFKMVRFHYSTKKGEKT